MPARILSVALCVFMSLYVAAASAATYVSDQLSINMRSGPDYSYNITELVEAGTRVTVLGRSDGWTKVRTPEGEVGFVLSRLLSNTPAAQDRLAGMQARVAELEQTKQQLEQKLATALANVKKLRQRKQQLVAENKKLKAELAAIKRAAANAVQLRKENQRLHQKVLAMKSEIQSLRAENQALQSRSDGMKVGAFILVVGIVLGLVLPMFRRRKRNTWDSL